MASGFPASIDNFTDPLSNSALNSPSHSALHSDVNDAVEKIETYMGLVKVIPTGATNGTVGSTGTVTIGSAVASVAVAGAFSTTYDNYLIQIINTVVSANQPNLGIQLTGTTSGYYYAGHYQSFVSATMTGDVTTTGTFFNIGACGNGTAGSGRTTMNITVKSPYVAQPTFFSAQNASLVWNNYYNGHMNNSTQYTGFTILPSSGTLTGGTIIVYGYRN